MNALHLTNIILNSIVRVLMTVCITVAAIKLDNFWLLFLYLIPGCMMANIITNKKSEGEKNDESNNDGISR